MSHTAETRNTLPCIIIIVQNKRRSSLYIVEQEIIEIANYNFHTIRETMTIMVIHQCMQMNRFCIIITCVSVNTEQDSQANAFSYITK